MKKALSRTFIVLAVTALFAGGLLLYYIKLGFMGGRWATYPTNRHLYSNGELVKAGTVTDRDGVVLAATVNGKRTYHKNLKIRKATLHAVGDSKGNISTGVQAAFLKELCGYDPLNGVYNVSGKGNDIQLTLDSGLCAAALTQLGSEAGTVGVYNYKTGEIVCMVSTPTYDPQSSVEPTAKGVYVNRLLSGIYTPGSVFKLVTTLSALENLKDVHTMHFTCHRGVTLHNEWLSCMGNHGTVGIEKALVGSCNAFFSQTALKIGRENLTATAQKVGFNKKLSVDGIECAQSSYQVAGSNDIDFGWSGIGQFNDLINPLQFLSFVGAIANGGVRTMPYMVRSIRSPSGFQLRGAKTGNTRLMSKENSEQLQQMMRKNVVENYGDAKFADLKVCGKTGTAEVGKNASPHSLFAGFCANEKYPYAFIVVVENAGSGNGAAVRIAANVLRSLEN